MKKTLGLLVMCTGCATQPAASPTFVIAGSDGVLGVGGRLFSSDEQVRLDSADASVVRVGDTPVSIVGVASGSADVRGFDLDGNALGEVTIRVAAVSELRLVGLPDRLDAGTAVDVVLEPRVGDAMSSGTHYYKVILDGEPYSCWGDLQRVCNGPVFHDRLHIDGLVAGSHQLDLQSVDGGADFSRLLIAE